MIDMTEEYDVALMLIYLAEREMMQQKYIDIVNENLSSDPFVLMKLQEFLTNPTINRRVKELTINMN